MIEFAVTSEINSLPNVAATLRNVYTLLAQNLRGTIQDDTLMSGQLGGDRPTIDKGPWMTDRAWQAWDDTFGYVPVDYLIENGESEMMLTSAPTTNRIQQLPDVNGVIATLEDAAGIREGIRLTGNNVAVDFKASDNFVLVLAYKDTLVQMVNHSPGEKVKILVLNQGTDRTPTWDASIQWPTAPTMPFSSAGETKGTYVVIRDINGVLYGEVVGNYAVSNVGQVLDKRTPVKYIYPTVD